MMIWKLFKHKRKEARPIAWWIYLQAKSKAWGLRVSGWLQRKTVGHSPQKIKRYSVLVLLVCASWNGWLIVQAVRHPAGNYPVEQIRMPNHVVAPAKNPRELYAFRAWLDSLKMDSNGRKIYDTIRRERPGLLDSLRQLEKMYSQ
jgi:hypothetical protein